MNPLRVAGFEFCYSDLTSRNILFHSFLPSLPSFCERLREQVLGLKALNVLTLLITEVLVAVCVINSLPSMEEAFPSSASSASSFESSFLNLAATERSTLRP